MIDAENYFVGPELDITRMNILQPGYLLTVDPHSLDLGRRRFLFRESSRSERLGFSVDECGIGHEVIGRHDSGHSNCRECASRRGRCA